MSLLQTMTGDARKISTSLLEAIEGYCKETGEDWGLVYSPSRWEKFIKWSKNKNV